PDGSRLAAVIPPVARPSPALVIRKFSSRKFTVEDLISRGTLTRPLAEFLAEQIRSGKTLLISGGTGTGKTTLLRILADFIPEQDRIVVIEDTSELHIQKPNILAVECQSDTFKANISFDDLLKSALRWRPDLRSPPPYRRQRLPRDPTRVCRRRPHPVYCPRQVARRCKSRHGCDRSHPPRWSPIRPPR